MENLKENSSHISDKVFGVGGILLKLKTKVKRLRNTLFFRVPKKYTKSLISKKVVFVEIKKDLSFVRFLSIPIFNKTREYFLITIYREFAEKLGLKVEDTIDVEIKELVPVQNEEWLINNRINLLAFLPKSFIAVKLTHDNSIIWKIRNGRGYRPHQIEITHLVDAELCSYVMGLLLAEGDKKCKAVLRLPNKLLNLHVKFIEFVKMLGNFKIYSRLCYNPETLSMKDVEHLKSQYEKYTDLQIKHEVIGKEIKDYVYISFVNSSILSELIRNVYTTFLNNFSKSISSKEVKIAHMFLLGIIAGDGSVEVHVRSSHVAQEITIALESEETCKKVLRMCKNLGYSAYKHKRKYCVRISLDVFKALQLLSMGIFEGNKNRAKLICAVAAKRNVFLLRLFKLFRTFSKKEFSIEDAKRVLQKRDARDTLLRMIKKGYVFEKDSKYILTDKGFVLMKTYEEILEESNRLLKHLKANSLIDLIKQLKNGKHCEAYPIP